MNSQITYIVFYLVNMDCDIELSLQPLHPMCSIDSFVSFYGGKAIIMAIITVGTNQIWAK